MPALLKQLQRSKSSFIQGVDSVLIRPDAGAVEACGLEGLDDLADRGEGTALQAERLLGELMAEAGSGGRRSEVTSRPGEVLATVSGNYRVAKDGIRIIGRREPASHSQIRAMRRDGVQPWWLSEPKRLWPAVETLIRLAETELITVYGLETERYITCRDMPAIEDTVATAVTVAAEKAGREFHILKRDRDLAQRELLSLLKGKGPLEPLFLDSRVSGIFVDGVGTIRALRKGQTLETPFSFRSEAEFRLFIFGKLHALGCDLTPELPMAHGIVNDEWSSRVNVLHGSLIDGKQTKLSICIPRLQQTSFYDLFQLKVLPTTVASWLSEVMGSREANILIVGPAGSGKTLMATALVGVLSSLERVVIVENAPEISVTTACVEKLVARPGGMRGAGEVTETELLQAAVNRSPHRIVLGDIRDAGAKAFLNVLECGFTGSIATLFATSGEEGLWRFIDLVAAHENAPMESILRRIARSVHLVVAMTRVDDVPCLAEILEVRGGQGGGIATERLVIFEGVVESKRCWRLLTERSFWIDRIQERGMPLAPGVSVLPPSGTVVKTSGAESFERETENDGMVEHGS